ncbi:MarR family winged helix-turn-helix transcriptional regulator [Aquimarina pacifica]|uniref:MarR family winged helix-turn-helix transcriptional regulator n=1 Tax=Aquimarina pacifica TaxID=1296415 RepID=UPI00047108F7|nr:MarR family transcriptional regulator [Aquimarina pacifica]
MKKSDKYLSKCLYFTSNALARKLTKLAEQAFTPIGLSPSYAFLLLLIHENPKITPSGLSKQLDLDPSTITRLADKMILRSLITKEKKGKMMHFLPTEDLTMLLPDLEKCWYDLKEKYDKILGVESADVLVELTFEASKKI